MLTIKFLVKCKGKTKKEGLRVKVTTLIIISEKICLVIVTQTDCKYCFFLLHDKNYRTVVTPLQNKI